MTSLLVVGCDRSDPSSEASIAWSNTYTEEELLPDDTVEALAEEYVRIQYELERVIEAQDVEAAMLIVQPLIGRSQDFQREIADISDRAHAELEREIARRYESEAGTLDRLATVITQFHQESQAFAALYDSLVDNLQR